MAGMSDYEAAADLNHWFRTTAPTRPAALYVALHTADPGGTGLNEVSASGTGYARVLVARADAAWTAPALVGTAWEIGNVGAITFATPTLDWGTVTHFSVWDAATAGSMLDYGAVAAARTILAGDTAPSWPAGSLKLRRVRT